MDMNPARQRPIDAFPVAGRVSPTNETATPKVHSRDSENVSYYVRGGFTLMELLVTTSIIALLASMLMGSIKMVRDQARSVKCLAGLRQVGIAKEAFALDNESKLVSVRSDEGFWVDVLGPYFDDTSIAGDSSLNKSSIFGSCPAYANSQRFTYSSGWGFSIYPLADEPLPALVNVFSASGQALWGYGTPTIFYLPKITYPTGRIMAADNLSYWGASDNMGSGRHNSRSNAVYFDGHGKSLDPAAAYVGWTNPKNSP